MIFNDHSTAGNANITNDFLGQIFFTGHSSAGNATITNSSFGPLSVQFQWAVSLPTTALPATRPSINNDHGAIAFGFPFFVSGFNPFDRPTAGNATITNNAGSTLEFNALSTAGNATIITNSGARSASSTPAPAATRNSSPTAPAMSIFPAPSAGASTASSRRDRSRDRAPIISATTASWSAATISRLKSPASSPTARLAAVPGSARWSKSAAASSRCRASTAIAGRLSSMAAFSTSKARSPPPSSRRTPAAR